MWESIVLAQSPTCPNAQLECKAQEQVSCGAEQNVPPQSADMLSPAVASLHERYVRLRDIRETRQERVAAELLSELEQMKQANTEYVEALKADIEMHKRNIASLNKYVETTDSLKLENELLRAQLEAADKQHVQLQLYHALTGLKIDVSSDGSTILCACSRPRSAAICEFTIDLRPEDGSADEWGYSPAASTSSLSNVPDYLHEEIICELMPWLACSGLALLQRAGHVLICSANLLRLCSVFCRS
eukprot:4828028-Pleurochrysis_carterae.AAC.2